MEDFYNAMTTYINSKKPKCKHDRTNFLLARMESLRQMWIMYSQSFLPKPILPSRRIQLYSTKRRSFPKNQKNDDRCNKLGHFKKNHAERYVRLGRTSGGRITF